jgi:hypothetical protein
MHRILFLPDIRPAGYLPNPKAGYPAGQSGIRPDTGYQRRPDYPAGYPVPPYFQISLKQSHDEVEFLIKERTTREYALYR